MQAVHALFTVAEGVFEMNVPGGHVAQATHQPAFAAVVHVPLAQAAQVRSCEVEGPPKMKEPAAQFERGLQVVWPALS